MKTLFALAALVIALPAFGATANLSFIRPSTYVDGSPLAAADIDGYELRCATLNGGACTIPAVTLAGTFTSGQVTVAVPTSGGNACFHVVTNVDGVFSVPSNQSCKVFAPTQPGSPTNVTIAVVIGGKEAPVFIYNSNNARVGNVAGSIDLGVPCTGAVRFRYRGDPYRQVPAARVRWWDVASTTRVAAPCASG